MNGYRTIIVNSAATLLPAVAYLLDAPWVVSVLGPQGAMALSILGLINMVLRWVTTTPIFVSEDP